MALDKDLTWKKLSTLWESDEVEILETAGEKYVIISDLHLGDGGGADDFRDNKDAMMRALKYYQEHDFKLILLGDMEELWQFDLGKITNEYNDSIYRSIRAFGENRVYRVYGNHDLDWSLKDPIRADQHNSATAVEALKMRDESGNVQILLVHGHQGSIDADKYCWISRFVVRGIFKPIEPLATGLGLYGHRSATKCQVVKDYERIFYSWAKENKVMLICGHSHRAIYASRSLIEKLEEDIAARQRDILEHRTDRERVEKNIKEIQKLNRKLLDEKLKGREIDPSEPNRSPLPCYFNTGCGLYSTGPTVLEINDNIIRLVKWHKEPQDGQDYIVYDDGAGKTISDFSQMLI